MAVVNRNGQDAPKIQIWRENETTTGVYYKPGPNIPLYENNPMCIRRRLGGGIFRCTLNETFQVPVQPGDILGLEIPAETNDNFDIYFTEGGPLNYIFEGQLVSDHLQLNLSEAHQVSNDMPQISVLVVLGNLTHMRASTHKHAHTYMHAHTHTHAHIHAHTCNTHKLKFTGTHTHSHTYSRCLHSTLCL